MTKSPFFWRIMVCLVPTVVALTVVSLAVMNYLQGKGGFKLGVDLVGGTILVYEVDPDKKLAEDYKPEQLVAALAPRINPADQKSITIRPVGKDRIEIILPTGGAHQARVEEEAWQKLLDAVRGEWKPREGEDYNAGRGKIYELIDQVEKQHPDAKHQDIQQFIENRYQASEKHLTGEEVQEIKEKIQQVGNLRFEILANESDDREAIQAARKEFEDARLNPNSEFAQELKKRAEKGLPPPPPGNGKEFEAGNNLGKYTYSWVEIGKPERHTLNLNNAAENDTTPIGESKEQRNALWQRVAAARNKGELVSVHNDLLYSRKVENPKRLPPKEQDKQYEYFFLTRNTPEDKKVTGKYLKSARSGQNDKGTGLAVHFGFNVQGGQRFYDLTSKNKPSGDLRRQLAIILDDQIVSAPSVNQAIRDSGIITGKFSAREVDRLVNILRAGALPATLKPLPVSENTIGPTLGDDTIRSGAFSVGLAFLAVIIFMLIYYRFAGLVASVALLCNLLFTVAFMVLVGATFTLPGLAGLVLMLGMAVDANILIYERLREERDRGASLAVAIRNGYDRAFPTIIDTHLSSIFTAIVLYVVGNDQLKGFGISLTIGLIISLFTSLYMTRLMFDLWLAKGWLHKLSMMRLFSRPNIDFMAIRYYWFTATIILTVLGTALFVYRLPSASAKAGDEEIRQVEGSILNIDFIGGTAYTGQLVKPMKIGELRELLGEKNQKELLNVKEVEALDPRGRKFKITFGDKGDRETREVELPSGDATVEELRADRKRLAELLGEDPLTLPKNIDVELLDPDPRATSFRIVYADGDTRKVSLASPALKSEVSKHAQILPDLSVEQIFVNDPKYTEGGASSFFTVRTSEKAPELVQASISRLLGGNKRLKQVGLKSFDIEGKDETARIALLTFDTFASPSQVRRLLTREFKLLESKATAEGEKYRLPQFRIDGLGAEDNGQYERMRLALDDGINRGIFTQLLEGMKKDFAESPQPERLENFDSQLAEETQKRALYAILASWGAILLYLWFRFGNWTFGLAAVVCLIHDLLFTLGIIAACHYVHDTWIGQALLLQDFKIDLQTVAALLTLVGYSVNDTIVVFDRIREVRGKNPELTPQTINDSVNQALSRTILTSVTVWLVVMVLYIWGGEGVHLFAFVMVVGVIVGTYSSIYIASPLLLIFGEGRKPSQTRERQPVGTQR